MKRLYAQQTINQLLRCEKIKVLQDFESRKIKTGCTVEEGKKIFLCIEQH